MLESVLPGRYLLALLISCGQWRPSQLYLDPLADYSLPPELIPPPELPSLALDNLPRTVVWAVVGTSAMLPCDIKVS
jgi:hypothetical protein